MCECRKYMQVAIWIRNHNEVVIRFNCNDIRSLHIRVGWQDGISSWKLLGIGEWIPIQGMTTRCWCRHRECKFQPLIEERKLWEIELREDAGDRGIAQREGIRIQWVASKKNQRISTLRFHLKPWRSQANRNRMQFRRKRTCGDKEIIRRMN